MSIYEEHKAQYEFEMLNPNKCYCEELYIYDNCQVCNTELYLEYDIKLIKKIKKTFKK